MKYRFFLKHSLLVILVLFGFTAFADTTFVKFGTSWSYLDNGSNQGNGWKELNASATKNWPSGPAEFGYGNGDERTTLHFGENQDDKYITTYFHTSVKISNLSRFTSFVANLYLEDGAIIYINGKEVSRINMPAGLIGYKTPASGHLPDNGNVIMPVSIPASSFKNGSNEIAVEVHQAGSSSDDLTFDLELNGLTGNPSPKILRGPMLQMVSTDAITIKWKTSLPTTSSIRYGISENALIAAVNNNTLTTEHEMRITGLQPDKKIYYAVGTMDFMLEGSYRNHFTTAPLPTTTRKIRIGVFGDAGTGSSTQKAVRDGYLKLFKKDKDAELALLLGDNAYYTGTDHEYQNNFFDIFDDNILNNHTVFAVPGNHEYITPGVPYFSVFSLPSVGESGGVPSGTESYYAFNYGNIHFIMLNSMGYDSGKLLYDSTGVQALWLKKDLAANAGTHKWTIVCLHHPPYTNGTHSSDGEENLIAIRQQITPILERFGVDAVLAGHSHVYERSFLIQGHTESSKYFKPLAPPSGNLVSKSSAKYDGSPNSCPYFTIDTVAKQGTVYVVAGSAGQIGGGTNAHLPLFYYKNYSGSPGGESGVLYLEVQDNRLDAKFVGLSGIVRDQFTIMKGVNTRKTVSVEVNNTVDLTASWIGAYNWRPTPPAGKDGFKTLSVKPSAVDTYVYLVKDSVGPSKTCISDTFIVRAYAGEIPPDTNYQVTKRNNKALLKWKVSQDSANHYFTIDRSANGRNFDLLTIVNSSGSSGGLAHYEFEDNYPLIGENYYRLTKTTKTGQNVILGIRELKFQADQLSSYSIKSAVEVNNLLRVTVQSSKKQSLGIKLFDINGRCLYNNTVQAVEGPNKSEILVRPGAYVVSVASTDGRVVTEKVVVR